MRTRINHTAASVEWINGREVLFSYTTPVAYRERTGGCYRTGEYYSNTTTRHINAWLNGRTATKVPQEQIQQAAEGKEI